MIIKIVSSLIVLLCIQNVLASPHSVLYHDFSVVRFTTQNEQELIILQDFVREISQMNKELIENWSEWRIGHVDVMVSKTIMHLAIDLGLEYSIYIENVQDLIDDQWSKNLCMNFAIWCQQYRIGWKLHLM
eukprot:TRINITY_DN6862_c0_g1_i2.p1 TRINITY_DN6862_c0_g1~~TRINITY_DN6862_c0_g1_i2.p1  ORF type:complete len:131 (+),score=18.56 TRINITY_DN6862_c0_g1_i2:160-552(+)